MSVFLRLRLKHELQIIDRICLTSPCHQTHIDTFKKRKSSQKDHLSWPVNARPRLNQTEGLFLLFLVRFRKSSINLRDTEEKYPVIRAFLPPAATVWVSTCYPDFLRSVIRIRSGRSRRLWISLHIHVTKYFIKGSGSIDISFPADGFGRWKNRRFPIESEAKQVDVFVFRDLRDELDTGGLTLLMGSLFLGYMRLLSSHHQFFRYQMIFIIFFWVFCAWTSMLSICFELIRIQHLWYDIPNQVSNAFRKIEVKCVSHFWLIVAYSWWIFWWGLNKFWGKSYFFD